MSYTAERIVRTRAAASLAIGMKLDEDNGAECELNSLLVIAAPRGYPVKEVPATAEIETQIQIVRCLQSLVPVQKCTTESAHLKVILQRDDVGVPA
jgi:hypothetical protein